MSDKKLCRVALVGCDGFGWVHLRELFRLADEGALELTAVADVKYLPDRAQMLRDRGVKMYNSLGELLANGPYDYVTLATPLPLHLPMVIETLRAGQRALVEKPPAATIQGLDQMLAAMGETGQECYVGFQMLASRVIKRVREIVSGGELGKVRRIAGMALWKRTDAYYARTGWAGKLKHGEHWVLDGTINNPLSHLLNNMMVVASDAAGRKLRPVSVQAELYHAHPIEAEDTSCTRILMDDGTEVFFTASLCSPEQKDVFMRVDGDRGTLTMTHEGQLHVRANGAEYREDFSGDEVHRNLHVDMLAYLHGETERAACPLEITRDFVLGCNGSFLSSGGTHAIDPAHVSRYPDGNTIATEIADIDTIVQRAWETCRLFSEDAVPWAVRTKKLDISNLTEFSLDL